VVANGAHEGESWVGTFLDTLEKLGVDAILKPPWASAADSALNPFTDSCQLDPRRLAGISRETLLTLRLTHCFSVRSSHQRRLIG